ncbi:ribonuclease HI [Sphingomonas sp. YR710]|uniref:reverse transcriptase-like protein n=1 Tax=Sphingomonas sp. YR710 TaxID=1882773 RepID=UPI0008890018|nr:reverse transcriptase-like protein [Sphingomonas sp. YR710]SDD62170.1 ribonuclease HI [Sphingomonas sp. YR710]
MKIFFDGGCRPNPGMMEAAVVAGGRVWIRRDLGHGTNDHAEWLALLYAVDIARMLGERDIVLIGDSGRVIHQAKGLRKSRAADLQPYLDRFAEAKGWFARMRIRQIGRAQNLAGIALEKGHLPGSNLRAESSAGSIHHNLR